MPYCTECQELYDKASDPKPKRKLALYNLKTEKTAILCGLHKKKDMINVISIRCGCGKIASFPGNYCKKCFVKNNPGVKPIDNAKKCQFKDCQKHPKYNEPGEKRGIYCLPHAILVWGYNIENVTTGHRPVIPFYQSYAAVVTALASFSLHFPDDYTENMFDVAVKAAKRPYFARHPIVAIEGLKRIIDVISEFRQRSPEEVQEYEKKFTAARDEIKEKTGHIITSCKFVGISPTTCTYTCGFCGTENQSRKISDFLKAAAIGTRPGCSKCCHWPEYDDVCADFIQNKNFVMAMTREEFYAQYMVSSYESTQITVQCKCELKAIFTARIGNLQSHDTRGCATCSENRRAKTSLERYGVPYPMQHPDVIDKCQHSAYTHKRYILPSGRKVFLQGFEYDAIIQLLSGLYICGFYPDIEFVEKTLMITKREVGSILYPFQGQLKHYFPDFKIVNTNVFIEVKSTYTLLADLERNLAKFKGVCDIGSRIIIMVLDHDKEDSHFAELDNTNIDAYISTMRRMHEFRCIQKMRIETVTEFRNWYDCL